jgi:hypothetical protein
LKERLFLSAVSESKSMEMIRLFHILPIFGK